MCGPQHATGHETEPNHRYFTHAAGLLDRYKIHSLVAFAWFVLVVKKVDTSGIGSSCSAQVEKKLLQRKKHSGQGCLSIVDWATRYPNTMYNVPHQYQHGSTEEDSSSTAP